MRTNVPWQFAVLVAVSAACGNQAAATAVPTADAQAGSFSGGVTDAADTGDGAWVTVDVKVTDTPCPPDRVPLVKNGVVVDLCGCCKIAPDCSGYFGGSPQSTGICPKTADAAPPCSESLDQNGCKVLGCSGSCFKAQDAGGATDAKDTAGDGDAKSDADVAPAVDVGADQDSLDTVDAADSIEVAQGCGPNQVPLVKNGVVVDPCGCCKITGGCEGYFGGTPLKGKCHLTFDAAPPCQEGVDEAGCPTLSCSGFCNAKPP